MSKLFPFPLFLRPIRVLFVSLCAMVGLTACEDPCEGVQDDPIGGEYFSVTYLDNSGANYLESIYRQSELVVYVDTSGGTNPNPNYIRLRPGYENGKFGLFTFTKFFEDAATDEVDQTELWNRPLRFDYYIKKDTFGLDKFSVEFLRGVNDCRSFWTYIRYYQNDQLLGQYDGQRQVEITITE